MSLKFDHTSKNHQAPSAPSLSDKMFGTRLGDLLGDNLSKLPEIPTTSLVHTYSDLSRTMGFLHGSESSIKEAEEVLDKLNQAEIDYLLDQVITDAFQTSDEKPLRRLSGMRDMLVKRASPEAMSKQLESLEEILGTPLLRDKGWVHSFARVTQYCLLLKVPKGVRAERIRDLSPAGAVKLVTNMLESAQRRLGDIDFTQLEAVAVNALRSVKAEALAECPEIVELAKDIYERLSKPGDYQTQEVNYSYDGGFFMPRRKREVKKVNLIEKIRDDEDSNMVRLRLEGRSRWNDTSEGAKEWLKWRDHRRNLAKLYMKVLGFAGVHGDLADRRKYAELMAGTTPMEARGLQRVAIVALGRIVNSLPTEDKLSFYLRVRKEYQEHSLPRSWWKVEEELRLGILKFPIQDTRREGACALVPSDLRKLLTLPEPKVRKAAFRRLREYLVSAHEQSWTGILNDMRLSGIYDGTSDLEDKLIRKRMDRTALRMGILLSDLIKRSKEKEVKGRLLETLAEVELSVSEGRRRRALNLPPLESSLDRIVDRSNESDDARIHNTTAVKLAYHFFRLSNKNPGGDSSAERGAILRPLCRALPLVPQSVCRLGLEICLIEGVDLKVLSEAVSAEVVTPSISDPSALLKELEDHQSVFRILRLAEKEAVQLDSTVSLESKNLRFLLELGSKKVIDEKMADNGFFEDLGFSWHSSPTFDQLKGLSSFVSRTSLSAMEKLFSSEPIDPILSDSDSSEVFELLLKRFSPEYDYIGENAWKVFTASSLLVLIPRIKNESLTGQALSRLKDLDRPLVRGMPGWIRELGKSYNVCGNDS